MPNLLDAGEFRAVAVILREVRVIGERAKGLTDQQRERLDNFRSQLSAPEVLTQLLQAVDEATAAPSADDLASSSGSFAPARWRPSWGGCRGSILPRCAIFWWKRPSAWPTAARARCCDFSASPTRRRWLERSISVAGFGCKDRCRPAITVGHAERDIRLASVKALVEVGTAGALGTIEKALDDADREVRITAVRALGARGYKNALKRIQTAVLNRGLKDADLTERIAFFEAYAMIAGPAALDPLARILIPGGVFRRKESAESRACAAIALSRLGTPEARDVLQQAREDKELVVRNAVNRALRESVTLPNPAG